MFENGLDKDVEKETNYIFFFIGTGVLIFLIWFLFGFIVHDYGRNYWSKLGTIGDTFGVLNTLFSGLAFGAMVVTLLMQRKELSLQREELEQTRTQIKRHADIANDQLIVSKFEIEMPILKEGVDDVTKRIEATTKDIYEYTTGINSDKEEADRLREQIKQKENENYDRNHINNLITQLDRCEFIVSVNLENLKKLKKTQEENVARKEELNSRLDATIVEFRSVKPNEL